MASEASSRPLLPHTTQGNGVNFIPSAGQKEPIQRNYVFVDEHNRHKRLKVMRACEGCRRRKIKCDSATTNTWPCAACVRLKLQCVPPSVSYDNEPTTPGTHMFELQKDQQYSQSAPLSVSDYQQHSVQHFDQIETTLQPTLPSPYAEVPVFHSNDYVESVPAPDLLKYGQNTSAAIPQSLKGPVDYGQPQNISPQSATEQTWVPEGGMTSLAEVFGDLQIGTNGTSPYIADQSKLANTPALQEYEVDLPNISLSPDMRVRIPPEMMPSEPQALEYFEYFFTNIHPFTPVLCQAEFYRSWNTNRDSLSPLVLEGIFACTTAMLQQPHECNKWLALAKAHEESFRDVPRLSTVQAQILILKARESRPNRGYFYRSWMSIVNTIAMAKDLNLQDHLESHEGGNSCQFTPAECVSRTRIWQLLFILEVMVGGPQGRLEYSVPLNTVDLNEPQVIAGIDVHERQISRQFLYFLRLVFEIRHTLEVYRDLRRKLGTSYCMDPRYMGLDSSYPKWFQTLPQDLQINVPKDGFEPWVSTSFLGNCHSYYYLSLIMHHRPQVHYLMEEVPGDSYKRYMLICLDAAKKLCRIQESMLRTLGPAGFESMIRGMSFTIYALLTCTMLHLAAITAPDPDISDQSRDYFIRCMRLLEECTPHWPMESMRKQVDGLREAFSADISKPFELKTAFPFGSPLSQPSELPIGTTGPFRQPQLHQVPLDPSGQVSHNITYPLTPPISIVGEDFKTDSPVRQPIGLLIGQTSAAPPPLQTNIQNQWNPTRIFDKWHSAFYNTARPIEDCSPTLSHVTSPSEYELPSQDYTQATYSPQSYTSETGQVPLTPQMSAPTSYPTYGMEFVSPSTWQDVVASSYGSRAKRKWTAPVSGVPGNKHLG